MNKVVLLSIASFAYIISFVGCVNSKSYSGQNNRVQTNKQLKFEEWKDPLFFLEGQLCQHVRCIFEDSKENLWIGTNVYGLMKFDGKQLHRFEKEDGIQGRITGIVEDENGTIWIGTAFGLSFYNGVKFETLTEQDGLINNEIWCLFNDKAGLLWIGTSEGLCTYDGENFSNIHVPKAQVTDTNTIYTYDRITAIAEPNEGTIWVGTDGFGITILDQKENQILSLITKENGLSDNAITEIFVDSKENIWIGSYFGGVSKYDGEKFIHYTKEGLIDGVEVSGFYEDMNKNIWFSVENEGVYQFDGEAFVKFDESKGLPSTVILEITEDSQGRFWLGGWGGLFRFEENSFYTVSEEGPWE